MFLKFEFQDDRSIDVGAVGGRNLPFPIDKAHRLYNRIVATAQAVIFNPGGVGFGDYKLT